MPGVKSRIESSKNFNAGAPETKTGSGLTGLNCLRRDRKNEPSQSVSGAKKHLRYRHSIQHPPHAATTAATAAKLG